MWPKLIGLSATRGGNKPGEPDVLKGTSPVRGKAIGKGLRYLAANLVYHNTSPVAYSTKQNAFSPCAVQCAGWNGLWGPLGIVRHVTHHGIPGAARKD